MERDYSYAVLIGRFQPFHIEHYNLVQHALKIAEKVIVLVGSSFCAPSPKNPFSFEQRERFIRQAFLDTDQERDMDWGTTASRLIIKPLRDYFYSNTMWLAQVQSITDEFIAEGDTVALLGAYKDASSYYLNMFPQWEHVVGPKSNTLDATDIRDRYLNVKVLTDFAGKAQSDAVYEAQVDPYLQANLPANVFSDLKSFRATSSFAQISQEYQAVEKYKNSWKGAPFAPTFVTADAVVTCAGHILVVKRAFNPGKGTYALPGGFVRPDEQIRAAALRELKEETRIRVDKIILNSSIVDSHVFDYPGRSLRGRTITHAYHVRLLDGKLPEVGSGSDSAKSFWMSLSDFFKKESEIFEDHYHIVQHFINR